MNFIKFIKNVIIQVKYQVRKKLFFLLAGKMVLEKSIPFVHSVDLVVVVSLTRTF